MAAFEDDGWTVVRRGRRQRRPGRSNFQEQRVTWGTVHFFLPSREGGGVSFSSLTLNRKTDPETRKETLHN